VARFNLPAKIRRCWSGGRGDALLVLDLLLDVLNRVRRLNVEGDRLASEDFDKDLHVTSAQTENEVEGGPLLDVVVGKCAAVLEPSCFPIGSKAQGIISKKELSANTIVLLLYDVVLPQFVQSRPSASESCSIAV